MSVVNVFFVKDTPQKWKASCRLCGEVVGTPNYGTSGMLAHLDSHQISRSRHAELASSLIVRAKGTAELSFGSFVPVEGSAALEESVVQFGASAIFPSGGVAIFFCASCAPPAPTAAPSRWSRASLFPVALTRYTKVLRLRRRTSSPARRVASTSCSTCGPSGTVGYVALLVSFVDDTWQLRVRPLCMRPLLRNYKTLAGAELNEDAPADAGLIVNHDAANLGGEFGIDLTRPRGLPCSRPSPTTPPTC